MSLKSMMLLLGAIVLGMCPALALSSSGPAITWEPVQLHAAVEQGATELVVLSVATSRDIRNAQISTVPELAPFIKVTPATSIDLSMGETLSVTVEITVHASTQLGWTEGTIRIRDGRQTIAKPLPVSLLVTRPAFSNRSGEFQFTHPPSAVVDEVAYERMAQDLFSATVTILEDIDDLGGVTVNRLAISRDEYIALLERAHVIHSRSIQTFGANTWEIFILDGADSQFNVISAFSEFSGFDYQVVTIDGANEDIFAEVLESFGSPSE